MTGTKPHLEHHSARPCATVPIEVRLRGALADTWLGVTGGGSRSR